MLRPAGTPARVMGQLGPRQRLLPTGIKAQGSLAYPSSATGFVVKFTVPSCWQRHMSQILCSEASYYGLEGQRKLGIKIFTPPGMPQKGTVIPHLT